MLAQSVLKDGGSDHSGALADGAKWTACMVLTASKVAGTTTQHTISNNQIRRLEYSTGVDRKELTVKNITSLDYVTKLSYTITLGKSGSTYYISSVVVNITTTSGNAVSFNISATFTCLVGVIGGNGWSGTKQTDSRSQWATLSLSTSDRGRAVSKTLSPSPSYPEYRFSGDIYSGQRIAAGDISLTVGSAYINGSFSINVAGGSSSY